MLLFIFHIRLDLFVPGYSWSYQLINDDIPSKSSSSTVKSGTLTWAFAQWTSSGIALAAVSQPRQWVYHIKEIVSSEWGSQLFSEAFIHLCLCNSSTWLFSPLNCLCFLPLRSEGFWEKHQCNSTHSGPCHNMTYGNIVLTESNLNTHTSHAHSGEPTDISSLQGAKIRIRCKLDKINFACQVRTG